MQPSHSLQSRLCIVLLPTLSASVVVAVVVLYTRRPSEEHAEHPLVDLVIVAIREGRGNDSRRDHSPNMTP
jgi:hypothetical protein